MPRVIWKGAISFGLVNIPVVLKPATRANALDLDLLDKRDMAPVGYQRINKHTGKPIERDNIVKGYQYEKDEYVVLSDEDFRQANVEATQTVNIVSFVEADAIPPYYFDTPYYLEPDKRGERGYALLHETMHRTGRAALAMVVLRQRQHLAALLVVGHALVLNTMRFDDEVLPIGDLSLPKGGKRGGATPREVQMATKLVEDMSEKWAPEQYRDTYRDDLMARIHAKIKAGKTHLLTPASDEAEAPRKGAKVIDMMALLKQSIGKRGKRAAQADADGDQSEGTAKSSGKASARPSTKASGKSANKSTTKSSAKSSAKASTTSSAKSAAKAPPARKRASKTTAAHAPARTTRAAKPAVRAAKTTTASRKAA
ncbi:non-homologous end joining protein Ku [Cupriavidus sp. RAF12]|uniref:non-homologous end joining protein Ku n=1 Tax=Cupriavidus sp. RAF12 TaxID=3233050 RepID=UPI003F8E2E6F